MEQEPDPLSYHHWGGLAAYHLCRVLTAYFLSHPSLISLAIGDLCSLLGALNKDGPGQCSGHSKQPNPQPVALGKCMLILFFISCPAILPFGMFTQKNDFLHSNDCCYIYRFD